MNTESLKAVIKQQTDAVITELEAYKRGYLNALSFIAQRIQDSEKIEDIKSNETVTDTVNR